MKSVPYLSAPVILLFQLPVIITDKFLVIIQQRVVLFMSSRHLDSQICCCTFLVSVLKNAINTLFFTILFTLFDRNVTSIIFPLTTICEYFPETFCSTEFQYNLYTGMHFIISMINASILTKMHSASYDLQFCSLSKICGNTIKYSKLVYILKYQRFEI